MFEAPAGTPLTPSAVTTSGQPNVRAEEALEIASKLHQPKDNLLVRFDPKFEYESKGEMAVRPVWTVQTLSPSPYVKVYVDAETGGHFRVLQSEAPSPKPEDLGFISLEKASESGTRGVNTSVMELGRGALLQDFRFDHPTKGQIELAVWRLELVSSRCCRSFRLRQFQHLTGFRIDI